MSEAAILFLTDRLEELDTLPRSKLRLYAVAVIMKDDRREALCRGYYGNEWRSDSYWNHEFCEKSVEYVLSRLDHATKRIYAANAKARVKVKQPWAYDDGDFA